MFVHLTVEDRLRATCLTLVKAVNLIHSPRFIPVGPIIPGGAR